MEPVDEEVAVASAEVLVVVTGLLAGATPADVLTVDDCEEIADVVLWVLVVEIVTEEVVLEEG